jgi:mycoredoxin
VLPALAVPLSMDAPMPSGVVTVYWRPGCPWCGLLRRSLRRAGLATREVDIWQDPTGAATVRQITGGDEIVPTVVVGDTSLVNPSAATVLQAARQHGITATRVPSRIRALGRRLGGAGSRP